MLSRATTGPWATGSLGGTAMALLPRLAEPALDTRIAAGRRGAERRSPAAHKARGSTSPLEHGLLCFFPHSLCHLCYDALAYEHGDLTPGREDTGWTLSRSWTR